MAAVKRCAICKQSLPLTDFNRRKLSKDGLQTHCRECNRSASRAYYRRTGKKHVNDVWVNTQIYIHRTRQFLFDYLLEHPCVDCGEADVVVLDFDHVRGEKSGNLSRLAGLGLSIDRLRNEIAKCEVRCVNCHRRRTAREGGTWRFRMSATSPPEGTGSSQ